MSQITTHVLNVALGHPAAHLSVQLSALKAGAFHELARGTTNLDGRVTDWSPPIAVAAGTYQLRFDTAGYFASIGCQASFYPEVIVCFAIEDDTAHFHVPLLLSPFGYTTYRGS